MILTSEYDPGSVKLNRHAKHPGKRSFSLKVIVETHRHWTKCSIGTTKVVGNDSKLLSQCAK